MWLLTSNATSLSNEETNVRKLVPIYIQSIGLQCDWIKIIDEINELPIVYLRFALVEVFVYDIPPSFIAYVPKLPSYCRIRCYS